MLNLYIDSFLTIYNERGTITFCLPNSFPRCDWSSHTAMICSYARGCLMFFHKAFTLFNVIAKSDSAAIQERRLGLLRSIFKFVAHFVQFLICKYV